MSPMLPPAKSPIYSFTRLFTSDTLTLLSSFSLILSGTLLVEPHKILPNEKRSHHHPLLPPHTQFLQSTSRSSLFLGTNCCNHCVRDLGRLGYLFCLFIKTVSNTPQSLAGRIDKRFAKGESATKFCEGRSGDKSFVKGESATKGL
jgi:hypothetical protein